MGFKADVEAYDIGDERIDLGSRVTLPKSWDARVSGEQDVPGTITVRVEWDAALGRTAVVFAALQREGEGVDITSQVLREVRTHWIVTSSALEVVTVESTRRMPAHVIACRCGSSSPACGRTRFASPWSPSTTRSLSIAWRRRSASRR